MTAELFREITFTPAYDCIGVRPCRFGSEDCYPGSGGSHGIHGVEMRWFLKGPDRAVQFVVGTQWQLDTAQDRILSRGFEVYPIGSHLETVMTPRPWDLGYHAPFPMYDGQTPMREACELTGGRECFYDGSSLKADEPFRLLREQGSDAVWSFLEDYYAATFSPGRVVL